MVFHPTVVAVRPERELRWVGHVWVPGLFDVEHRFLLAPEGAGTRFTQMEQFHGLALWFYDPEQLRPTFDAMNRALKAQAERP